MKRVFITMALCLAFVGLAQAQLSQGQTYSTKIVTGNRPVAGDWGLYFGPSYSEIADLVETWGSQDEKAFGLPLINLKYYLSDRTEMRFGIQYNGHTTNASGNYNVNFDEIYDYYEEDFGTRNIPLTDKYYTRRFRVSPGIAYHFSPKNILDVYVGATIPVGVDAMNSVYETENYQVVTNDATGAHSLQKYDVKDNYNYNSFTIGLWPDWHAENQRQVVSRSGRRRGQLTDLLHQRRRLPAFRPTHQQVEIHGYRPQIHHHLLLQQQIKTDLS